MRNENVEGNPLVMKIHDWNDEPVEIAYDQIGKLGSEFRLPTTEHMKGYSMPSGPLQPGVAITLKGSNKVVYAPRRHKENDTQILSFLLTRGFPTQS